jgi:hypothetical protein
LGGRFKKLRRGLAPAPFFLFPTDFSGYPKFKRLLARRCAKTLLQKNERPVGVPAALAWGLGGNLTEDQGRREFSCRTGCGALAKIRKMHSTKNAMTMWPSTGAKPCSR